MTTKSILKKAVHFSFVLSLAVCLFSSCANNKSNTQDPSDTQANTVSEEETPTTTMDKYDKLISEHPEFEGLSHEEIDAHGDVSPNATYGYSDGYFAHAIGRLPKDGETVTFDPAFCLVKNDDGEIVKLLSATRTGNFIFFESENSAAFEENMMGFGKLIIAEKEAFGLYAAVSTNGKEGFASYDGDVFSLDDRIVEYAKTLPDGEIFIYAQKYDLTADDESMAQEISDVKKRLNEAEVYSESENYFSFNGNQYYANGKLWQEHKYTDPYNNNEEA